jgi:hypothetical protein
MVQKGAAALLQAVGQNETFFEVFGGQSGQPF